MNMNRQMRRHPERHGLAIPAGGIDLAAQAAPQFAAVHDPIMTQALGAHVGALHDMLVLNAAIALLTTQLYPTIEEALAAVMSWRNNLVELLPDLEPEANGDADEHGDVDSSADVVPITGDPIEA